jgi:hypothetical protein
MTRTAPALPASVTTETGAATWFGFSPIANAELLHAYAQAGDATTVSAGPRGWTIAELTVEDGRFVMNRRDANDAVSTHSLMVIATDAERLLAHWKVFVAAAMRDHEIRRARVAG